MARRKPGTVEQQKQEPAEGGAPSILTPEGLAAYREELERHRLALIGKINGASERVKEIQAEAAQLVGALNQVAGQIVAVERMQGKPSGQPG